MANTITIKHGPGMPNGKLQPYELGICDDDGMLYIGTPFGDEAYPLMWNYLSKYGGTIEGDLEVLGAVNVSMTQENDYEGIVTLPSTGIMMYAGYENGGVDWNKGLYYYFDKNDGSNTYLGSISMTGTDNYVDCVYVGQNADKAWLKIIPEVGIQTDSIILNPYDRNTKKGSFGYDNPNEANIPGVPGQLYFVITG